MTFRRLAKMIGQSTSTTHYWFEVFQHPHVIALMCLLERLGVAERNDFLQEHCRLFPELDDERLKCYPVLRHALFKALSRDKGLTLITGSTEYWRCFMATALGHTYVRIHEGHRAPTGIDLQPPNKFVPVESLNYIDKSVGSRLLQKLTLQVLPRILTSDTSLLIFNGVWSEVPQSRVSLMRAACLKHVIILEQGIPQPLELKGPSEPPEIINLPTIQESAKV